MNRGRETVYQAFFELMKKSAGFNTISRIPIPSDSLAGANLPALEVVGEQETAEFRGLGLMIVWKIQMLLLVYCDTSDPSTPAFVTLNALLDSIDKALTPDPQTGKIELFDADGVPVVVDVHFSGTILKDPSFQSGIGAAGIPIEIVTTA